MRATRRAVVGLLALCVLLHARPAAADSFDDGKSWYALHDYDRCIALLRSVLYTAKVSKTEENVAREVLAACYFNAWVASGKTNEALKVEAEREAKTLVFDDADYKLAYDKLDAGFRTFFADLASKYRAELKALEADKKRRKEEEERILRAKIREEFEALYASKEPMVFKIVRSRDRDLKVAHFVPFYGQIYNKDYAAAVGFGASTAGLVVASLYTYAGLASWLKFDCTRLAGATITNRWKCPPVYTNIALARAYRAVNILSTVSTGVVLAAGVLHAAIRGRDVGEVTREMTTAEKIRLGIWRPSGDFAPPLPGTAGDDAEKTAPAKKDTEPPKELDPGLYLVPFEAPADAGATFGLGLELHF